MAYVIELRRAEAELLERALDEYAIARMAELIEVNRAAYEMEETDGQVSTSLVARSKLLHSDAEAAFSIKERIQMLAKEDADYGY